ncbi:NAD-dependent epimerase/dehydratase family protein [Amycolatopsis palatopharyngis]|uniref:NAD-dependent epimerase/dehydratase family protein n=1 Tax=Amycolatopsis palatopharyngis TaxID=187982 RepID=UPI000E249A55|nr:NAD-dependent epimerase/dehydratase family protein [Amycolatopsis palatopharyngis]
MTNVLSHTAGTPTIPSDSGRPRRVVVTGAAGFIGGHLITRLIADGASVVGLDRRDPACDVAAAQSLGEALGQPAFTFRRVDLTSPGWEPLLSGAEVVFHLAALPGVRPSWGPGFDDYAMCNVVATQRVMDVAIQARVPRVVVASSSSVYGSTGGGPTSETVPTRPLSPYGVTKLATEALALAHAQRHDSATTVAALRYFTVYGPRQRSDMLIGRALTAALGGGPVVLYGSGEQSRDFTYIGDIVEATIAASRTQASGAFNIGAGRATSVREVLRVAEDLTGRPVPVTAAPAGDGDVPATLADSTLARDVLGWQPQVELTTGMRRHLDWLRSYPIGHADATATA